MSDKKKKSAPEAKPTISFAQSMANAQLKALEAQLKPYIDQMVDQKMAKLAQEIFMSVYRVILKDKEFLQIRHMALESALKDIVPGFTDEVLADSIAKVEDQALKMEEIPAEEGIKEMDSVRLEISEAKPETPTEFGASQKVVISAVTQVNKEGKVQTFEELEKSIVGMKKGEERSFAIPQPDSDAPENMILKVKIKRISRKKEAPANEQNSSGQ